MKVIILDGSQAQDTTGVPVRQALTDELHERGWDIEQFTLRDMKIRSCAGDFSCWVRNPGICQMDDDNRTIAAAMVGSNLMIYLTPVTFGGYSSILKRAVDHLIQNISPSFTKVGGETHHKRRYREYPDFLAIGWTDMPDVKTESIFHHLIQRNAINFYARKYASAVVIAGRNDCNLSVFMHKLLDEIDNKKIYAPLSLPEHREISCAGTKVQNALLLVGSPRMQQSSSNILGEYLFDQMGTAIRKETVCLHRAVRSPADMKSMMDAVDAADLVTLVFPLYVDSLPAPVIEALEKIASHRQDGELTKRPLFTAIANCGFPEAYQNATAIAICETFAHQAKFEWAGSLMLGAGGMINGQTLVESGRRTVRVRNSLEMAARALIEGQTIPDEAQDLLAKPAIPAWLYRMVGNFGWKMQTR